MHASEASSYQRDVGVLLATPSPLPPRAAHSFALHLAVMLSSQVVEELSRRIQRFTYHPGETLDVVHCASLWESCVRRHGCSLSAVRRARTESGGEGAADALDH
eukprot:6208256-Pleurochrysis_carterae.AAC.4